MKKSEREKLRETCERVGGVVITEYELVPFLDYVDRLEDALKFYANEKTWRETDYWTKEDGSAPESVIELSRAVDDTGERARQVLEGIEE